MSITVLVVDDQKVNRTILSRGLEKENYRVVTASNGQEAIDCFEKHDIDMVLLDALMPVMDGFEAAPKLKALSKDVYLPIIFLTALEDKLSLQKCLEVGGDDFLSKPFDNVILSSKIKAHARTRRLSQRAYEQNKELDFYRAKTEHEFQIVEHIYDRALSKNYSAPTHIRSTIAPAALFNGDILLSSLGPTGNLYVMMGDFTGHGLASSIGTLPVSKAFYTLTNKGMSVADIATELNHTLLNFLPNDMFCAATIVELSYTGNSITIWAGGAPDIYILDDDGVHTTIVSMHMPLGILEEHEFESTVSNYHVSHKDKVFICSDGVTELENVQHELFGDERLRKILTTPADNHIPLIEESLLKFKGEQEQGDDITMLELLCLPNENLPDAPIYKSSKLNHSCQLNLDAATIRTSQPVEELVNILSGIEGVEHHKSNLYLLITEAYNNALEHGLLNLSSKIKKQENGFLEYYQLRQERLEKLKSGDIKIAVEYEAKSRIITIIVNDSGQGFDTTLINSIEQTMFESPELYGRGLPLIQQLSKSMSTNDIGNQITIKYQL